MEDAPYLSFLGFGPYLSCRADQATPALDLGQSHDIEKSSKILYSYFEFVRFILRPKRPTEFLSETMPVFLGHGRRIAIRIEQLWLLDAQARSSMRQHRSRSNVHRNAFRFV